MLTGEIKAAVMEIAKCASDPEEAHELEDELRRRFIEYVASLKEPDPLLAEKATMVLSTKNVHFPRWRA